MKARTVFVVLAAIGLLAIALFSIAASAEAGWLRGNSAIHAQTQRTPPAAPAKTPPTAATAACAQATSLEAEKRLLPDRPVLLPWNAKQQKCPDGKCPGGVCPVPPPPVPPPQRPQHEMHGEPFPAAMLVIAVLLTAAFAGAAALVYRTYVASQASE